MFLGLRISWTHLEVFVYVTHLHVHKAGDSLGLWCVLAAWYVGAALDQQIHAFQSAQVPGCLAGTADLDVFSTGRRVETSLTLYLSTQSLLT